MIAQVNGRETPEKVVLIGAHLDSWDLGTGALDDGAGVAITSAAAHLIGELPRKPRSSIRLVLFGNEEAGLWGAKQYVADNTGILDDHLYASESDFGAGPVWRFDTDNPVLMETGNGAMPVLEVLGIEKGEAASSGASAPAKSLTEIFSFTSFKSSAKPADAHTRHRPVKTSQQWQTA